jgi:hypothetical protein
MKIPPNSKAHPDIKWSLWWMNKNLTPFFPLSLKKEEGRDRNVA